MRMPRLKNCARASVFQRLSGRQHAGGRSSRASRARSAASPAGARRLGLTQQLIDPTPWRHREGGAPAPPACRTLAARCRQASVQSWFHVRPEWCRGGAGVRWQLSTALRRCALHAGPWEPRRPGRHSCGVGQGAHYTWKLPRTWICAPAEGLSCRAAGAPRDGCSGPAQAQQAAAPQAASVGQGHAMGRSPRGRPLLRRDCSRRAARRSCTTASTAARARQSEARGGSR